MEKESTEAAGLDGVLLAAVAAWLEEALSSVLLSGGVRGGVGKPGWDEEDEWASSLPAPLRDGFLSWTCCFCCTASSCRRSGTQTQS